ncbi:S-layer homology domain-containing protein [Tumebacillus sp. ITR2]|uniref:S-layer homology domain-containing protein n=1 Tax=Tumebacillus amylolyticus TaxID=2801339 RepID=A0ABS1J9T2_9BACL|nr:S-layer homology domain-containing protein [Tumebacillus amylolyticus]MBL0387039.1 S-layer homology domain-containing protein [Tumebacillus amylolyticus]
MASYLRKMALILASGAVTTTFVGFASAGNVVHAADNRLSVQMVEDCQTVGAGGEIGYHILYHNVENKNNSQVQLKVKVPEGLDVDESDDGGATWDASTRFLTWNLKDVENNGARVTHFNLKVKGDVAIDTNYELSCVVEEDGKWKMETPKIKFKTGTSIDQPFFVGYPDGKFHPDASITRAEAAAVVARVAGLADGTALAKPYGDVPSNHWAASYINKVSHAGYMSGYGDGTFHPDAPITRAELVRLMLTMRGVQEAPFVAFDDSSDSWAKEYIGTAKALNWLDGDGNGKFRPNDATDRESAAKLFDIALFRGPLKDGTIPVKQHFPDVSPKSWSFGWVEEASTVAHESVHRGRGIEQLIRYLPEQTKPM